MDRAVFLSYNDRVLTFARWPSRDTLDIGSKAKAGFYYPVENTIDGKVDRLQCAFCPCSIADWTPEDDPWKVHAQFLPRCIHVMSCKGIEFIKRTLREENQTNHGEIPLQPLGNELQHYKAAEEVKLFGTSGPFRFNHQRAFSTNTENTTYTTPGGILFREPLDATYGDLERRLASFSNMPEYFKINLPLRELVASGQRYEGYGDKTRCYYCGFGFQNWDQKDDPWKEHVRFSPHCFHTILIKGEDYVFDVMKGLSWNPRRQNPIEDVLVHRNLKHQIDDNDQGNEVNRYGNKRPNAFSVQIDGEKERHPPTN